MYLSSRDQRDYDEMMDKVPGIKDPAQREAYLLGAEVFFEPRKPVETPQAEPEQTSYESLRGSSLSTNDARRFL